MTNPQSARDLARENAHALIVDLVRKRDDLTRVLKQRDALTMAINGLVTVYGVPPNVDVSKVTNTVESIKPHYRGKPGRVHPVILDTEAARPGVISDTVLLIAVRQQLTSIDLTNQVEEQMRLHGFPTTRAAIQSSLHTLLKEGKLHKGIDLLIRPVKDGVVQGLPPMPPGPFTSFADGREEK